MLMNDKDVIHNAKSPLKTDEKGRFSRKGKVINKLLPFYPFFDDVYVILFSFFLVAIDFVLFAGSGNIEIFKDSFFPIPEVMLNLGIFFLVISLIVAIFHKSVNIKAGIASAFAFFFVFVIYKQFSQLNQSINAGDNSLPISIIIGIIFAFIAFGVYSKPKTIYKIFLTLTPIILFFNICSSLDKQDKNEFITINNAEQQDTVGNDERLIYFMLPNFISYNQIDTWKTDNVSDTVNLTLGFYQKNNFKVFNNAYVETPEYFDNWVMFLNPKAKKDTIKNYTLKTMLLSGYWKFSNLNYNNINLKENELYDYLSYQGFQISAYKSRNIDLCRKNHQMNVQRCIEKVNKPTNIYDTGLSLMTRTNILFMEWFFSLKIGNMLSFYEHLASKLNMPDQPQISIMYNNLYVVNSIKFFDILFDNIKEDTGKQAYFVFADIPSDMYIYDEFCRIKPKDKWFDRANLPWIKKDYTKERKEAYLQQYRCLYGKMQQFMEKMKDADLLSNTKIVLMGASNVNNFQSKPSDDYVERFMDNNLVSMAIYDGTNDKFEIDTSICSIKNIMMKQLFDIGECGEIENIHEQIALNLKNQLNKTRPQKPDEHIKDFDAWYEKWKEVNAK